MAKHILFRRSTRSEKLVNFLVSQMLSQASLLGNATFTVEKEGDESLIVVSSKKYSGRGDSLMVGYIAGIVKAYCALTGESSYDV